MERLEPGTSEAGRLGLAAILRGLVLLGALAAIALLLNRLHLDQALRDWRFGTDAGTGWMHGRTAFVIGGAGVAAVGAPRQAVAFFAAYFFGLWDGLVLALIAAILGAALAYGAATLFRGVAARLLSGRLDKAIAAWRANTFATTLILRLLPLGSNLMINLAAGLLRLPVIPFLAGSLVGYVPQTLVFAMMGAGADVGSGAQIAVSVALLGVSTLIGLWAWRRHQAVIAAGEREPAD